MLFEENTVGLTHYDTLSFSVLLVCLFLSFVKVDLTTVYLFLSWHATCLYKSDTERPCQSSVRFSYDFV